MNTTQSLLRDVYKLIPEGQKRYKDVVISLLAYLTPVDLTAIRRGELQDFTTFQKLLVIYCRLTYGLHPVKFR